MTKSELFDPNNLNKRVLEHFGRRTSVAKILPDIENTTFIGKILLFA